MEGMHRAPEQLKPVLDAMPEALHPLDHEPPFRLFGKISDEAWSWLLTEGREQCEFLDGYLPSLTGDPEYEAGLVGSSGRDALRQGFNAYETVKSAFERHARPLDPTSRVLDFGCGWGRVIRFFLKDVAPENLVGIDVKKKAIATCVKTNRWCQFERCDWVPPTGFDADSFDLVYAAFVFSHLSEGTHAAWLEEFARLLKPGGVLVLTTFQRELLELCQTVNSTTDEDLRNFAQGLTPVDPLLAAYDQGEFCYRGHEDAPEHYGLAFISERYVREQWTKHFDVREYFGVRVLNQNVIVCTKPA